MRAATATALLAAAIAAAQEPDPCLQVPDPAERVDCYTARAAAPRRPAWRIGEETDPITDRTSVVLTRSAAEAVEGPEGTPVLPALTLVCYRGSGILLSLEAGEPLAAREDGAPVEIRLTTRIGPGPPAERTWTCSGPGYRGAWLDVHAGALILARALAEEDPGQALFRYHTLAGQTRTARFGLDGLARLLPRVEQACGVHY